MMRALKENVFDIQDEEHEEELKEYFNYLHTMIIPFKMQVTAQLYSTRTYEDVELEQNCIKLKKTWSAKKTLEKIKKDLYVKAVGDTKKRLQVGLGCYFSKIKSLIVESDDEDKNDSVQESEKVD